MEVNMVNKWPEEYLNNPNIEKPIEQIWVDIDNFSFEDMYEGTENLQAKLRLLVPFPPLNYKGKFIKGFFYSNGSRTIMQKYPEINKLFFVIAESMFASYPKNHKADYFFTLYKNEARERYYKNKYPETKNIICLPLQNADFKNEYDMGPTPNTSKTIDVFCVSTPFPVKNLPIIAKALKEYERKYAKRLKVVYAIGTKTAKKCEDGSLDYSEVIDYGKTQLQLVDEIFNGRTKDYIDFYPWIDYKDLPKYYSASKCFVLGSLIEGKNRAIVEAQCCDTPIIVFKQFNQYVRGDFPIFFGNAGEYVPEFTPESLADTIHKVITHPENYEPRKSYLEHYGRKNFVNTIIDANSYYAENIPNYEKGRIQDNLWVDLACYDNYQVCYHDFLYGKKINFSHVVGIQNIDAMAKRYYEKFGLPWKYD